MKVQTEIAYLSRHKAQLAERLSEAEGLSQLDQQYSECHQEELRKLENEKVCKITVKLVGNTIFYFIIHTSLFYSVKVRTSKSLCILCNPLLHIKADISEKFLHSRLGRIAASMKCRVDEVSVRELCSSVRISFCDCYI